ncbi:MAG: hypothetical protein LW707_09300, partial [Sphingobacteriales bacterium]|nr:hypothetical protein [Sphingobacteriales bacterium]
MTGNVTSVTTSSNPYNLVVSPTVTTGYTLLTVSDAQCSGAASGTALVTVGGAGQTPVVSGNASVCRGQTGLVYSTPAQSGSTYSWAVPTGVTITPVSATTLKAQLLFECGGFELSCYNPANGTYTFTN